jgi:hypothetical protein
LPRALPLLDLERKGACPIELNPVKKSVFKIRGDMELILEFANAILTIYVYQKLDWLGHHESYVAAGLFSLGFFWLSRLLVRRARENKVADGRFAVLGTWIQQIDFHGGAEGNSVSYVDIKYNSETTEFEVVGRAFYEQDMNLYACWQSMYAGFPERDAFHYAYKGKIQNESRHDVVGTCRIAFLPYPKRHFDLLFAEGSFHDATTGNEEISFRMRRATKREIEKLFLASSSRVDARAPAGVPPKTDCQLFAFV